MQICVADPMEWQKVTNKTSRIKLGTGWGAHSFIRQSSYDLRQPKKF